MPKFQKKPVIVEAFQMTQAEWEADQNSGAILNHWPAWLREARAKPKGTPGSFYLSADGLAIETLEGSHYVTFGDWIIQGVQGELYPCKPDIFAATYSPA